jgi:hypothetical protein
MTQSRSAFTSNRTDFLKITVGVAVAILNPASAVRAQELVHPRGFGITTSQVLYVGDYITSINGKFWAIMQDDGNFCVYEGSSTSSRRFLWGSVQAGRYEPARNRGYFAVMQKDGNFCVYQGSPDRRRFLWGSVQAAGYQPMLGDYAAQLDNDGNFCVYRLRPPGAPASLLFSTDTADASR